MDEESLKRNTDCVYFLASPLTCKKGIECEYRHSEMARLNPRECWYWLSGSCLNPSCAFRHPPLDGHTGELSEPAPSSIPVNKTNVPCYYYFSGYCNKGERCSFLHDQDTEAPQSGKLVKTTSNSEMPHLEPNMGSAPTNGHLNPSSRTKVEVDAKNKPKEEFQIPALKDVPSQSSSPQISVSEDEEITTIRPHTLPSTAGFAHGISFSRGNFSLDEQVCEQIDGEETEPVEIDEEDTDGEEIELEERWESSPGFDVLVDGEAENLDSEDGQEYILALDRRRDLSGRFSDYDFENPVAYNPDYPNMECHYVSEVQHQYNPEVNEEDFGDVKNVPFHSTVRMFDSIISHKRKLMPLDLGFDDHKGADLRDRLRRHRFIDYRSFPGLSRIHKSGRTMGRIQERPWQRGNGHLPRHGRLASEAGRYRAELLRRNGFPTHSKPHRSRKQYKEKRRAKRQCLSPDVSKERRSTHDPTAFSGPKTLDQIKEEKRKAQENSEFAGTVGQYRRKASADFEGPRPLGEILKDKGKL